MQKTIIQSKVTIVLQITAGQPLDAIVHEGKAYIEYPMPEGISVSMEGTTVKDEPKSKAISKVVETARESKKVEDVATAKKEVAVKEAAKVAKKVASTVMYTEEELMDVENFPVTKLTKICAERGIDIPKEGKNTNKKLRLLILDAQKDAPEEEEEEGEDPMDDVDSPPAPVKKGGKKAPVVAAEEEDESATLIKLFTDFDDVEIDEKQLLAGLVDFGYIKKDAQGIIDDFNAETEMEIADFVAGLLDEEEAEEEEEEAALPVKKGGKKEAKKEKVEFTDLEVGDKVSVYFESEEDYFDGVVASIGRGGKVTVDYDDNTTDVLTKEENTTVYRK